jgi:hypothetical protein
MNEKEIPDVLEQPEQEQPVTDKPVPIEVKWNIPAWMLRDPGPLIEVEDDDIEWL